jgi:hypothetical protein
VFGLSCEQPPAEILAAAAYSLRRSSNAKSLCSVVAPNSSKILAATPADFDPDGFRSSSPTTPARQSSRFGVISGCMRKSGGLGWCAGTETRAFSNVLPKASFPSFIREIVDVL